MTELETLLRRRSGQLGIELAGDQAQKLCNYLGLLLKWNEKINLVSVRGEDELVTQHVVDCLAAASHIPAGATRIIDVGSGAGLPGAVIAIVRPDIEVTALEPIRKKHAFLATVRRAVPIPNLAPRAQRLEAHRGAPEFRPYDAAVSRATFSIPEWLELAPALVRPGGTVLAMEGAEKHELPTGATRHPYRLGDRTRAIIALASAGDTAGQTH